MDPQQFGPYRIVSPLGRGGMGVVYLALDTRLGRQVAVKVLPAGADRDALARFLEEARTSAALKHPQIATLLDVGEEAGVPFLVMEYVEGESLARALDRGPLPWGRVVTIGLQLAGALDHAHGLGVLHRDIKPGNILLSPARGAVLLDFGVARWLRNRPASTDTQAPTESSSPLSVTGKILGTAAYLSPEQLAGETLDERSDLFQLGIVLYEAAVGRHPFAGPTQVDIQHAILRGAPHPLPRPDLVPDDLARALDKLLEKDPGFRYPSARSLEVDLRALERETTATQVGVTGVRSALRRRHRRIRGAGWALAAAAIAVVTAVWLGREWPPAPTRNGAVPDRIVPLTHGEGSDTYPSFSPDGRSLVFASDRGGTPDLWVLLVSGGTPVPITRTPEVESQPAWSPDGERVAFVANDPQGGRPSIHVVPALGGDRVKVVENAQDPAWSPDGKWLAFADVSGDWARLARRRADGTGAVVPITLPERGFFHRRPAWTPDGASLVFNRSPGGWVGMLLRVDLSGGPLVQITDDPRGTANLSAAVTPDGRFVVHVSDRGGGLNLWRVPLAGGPPERITSGPGRDLYPAVSGDGRRIAFVVEPVATRLLRLPAGGGAPEVLRDLPGSEGWAPVVSADGKQIALSRQLPGGGWDLVALRQDGSGLRTVLEGVGDIFRAGFLPGEQALVFGASGPDGDRVGRVDLDGGDLQWLTPAETRASYPTVSPDGGWLAYARSGHEGETVVIRPLLGGPERVLVEGATLPMFSPDGDYVAVARSRSYHGGVGTVSVATGEIRWLTESGSWPVWASGGAVVAFADAGMDGRQRALAIPITGGEPRLLHSFRWHGSYYPFQVDPVTADLITIDAGGGPSTIWMAEYGRSR